jgi:hypothetical protein
MTLQTLYDAPTLTISYDYAHDWLYLDWHGALDDDSVMAGALKLLELLKQEKCSKVLNDNTHITGYEAGCRHFFWVYSPERFSQLSAQLAVEHTTAGITIMTFQSFDTASEWLQRM